MRITRVIYFLVVAAALLVLPTPRGTAQKSSIRNPDADWPMFNRDLAGTRFSPLTQINTSNVANLKQVWTYKLRPHDGKPLTGPAANELFQEMTPIVANGVMYLPAANRVVALEPETGKEIWSYELKEGQASFRGVSYWPGDKNNPPRILFTTARKLVAVNAVTGEASTSFGNNGEIEMKIPYVGAPTVYKNVILMGSNFYGPGQAHIAPQMETSAGEPGDTHAYDARTGKELWEFHTIPRKGEPGNETWGLDSWKNRTGNNVWAFALTADEQRGIVYLPVSSPGANYYGGDRPGNNLYGNSTVAVDIETGKIKWYFQTMHHELWDYNLPPGPSLFEVTKDGRKIPALAQTGKMGWVFILDRVTGKPVFGVEERPIPPGDVPTEWYSPTQPFPLKPPPVARVSITADDLVTDADTTPEHAQACRELWEKTNYYNVGPYTNWKYRKDGNPPSIIYPGGTGGPNWGGTAVDTKLNYLFVNSKDAPATGWIEKNARYEPGMDLAKAFPYIRVNGPAFVAQGKDANGNSAGNWPCARPPWARLVAINVNTGDIAWQVPLGVNETLPPGKQNVGSPGGGGPIATAGGLVFIGATSDLRFRAFESRTGKELWSAKLDYNITATPMTYQGKDGKQYVAVVAAAGGVKGANAESVVVFALP
ncbi:MAG TPA: PQQ-binding-like beta-propeller repeat protein [Terriglobia bacterium]|nr:PQQ-binding-like beta-propeller repeat protein [Terriglobia bacterium]